MRRDWDLIRFKRITLAAQGEETKREHLHSNAYLEE